MSSFILTLLLTTIIFNTGNCKLSHRKLLHDCGLSGCNDELSCYAFSKPNAGEQDECTDFKEADCHGLVAFSTVKSIYSKPIDDDEISAHTIQITLLGKTKGTTREEGWIGIIFGNGGPEDDLLETGIVAIACVMEEHNSSVVIIKAPITNYDIVQDEQTKKSVLNGSEVVEIDHGTKEHDHLICEFVVNTKILNETTGIDLDTKSYKIGLFGNDIAASNSNVSLTPSSFNTSSNGPKKDFNDIITKHNGENEKPKKNGSSSSGHSSSIEHHNLMKMFMIMMSMAIIMFILMDDDLY